MKKKLGPAGFDGLLILKYSVGCRRPTPEIGYLEALTADYTLVVFGEIKDVEDNCVIDHKGKRHCIDILVCATGFDTPYVSRFLLLREKKRNVQDLWANPHQTKPYLATTIPNFSNYFTFFGPTNLLQPIPDWNVFIASSISVVEPELLLL
jgi:cation diffusion facilitator CzcD-associated flavoprotein CzcO